MSGLMFDFDITTDLVKKQKKSMFNDQHFMDVEVAEEFAQPYIDKDVKLIQRLQKKYKIYPILTDSEIIKSFTNKISYLMRSMKQLEPWGVLGIPQISLDRNWGNDVIPYIRQINELVKQDVLVCLTDRQKYVYDKFQQFPKGIDSVGLVIANNTVTGDECQNQTMLIQP
ncbi:MAG: hypothetical protein EZS28_030974 [Streblomastix strix]|uniref:Uncharacterized protein n=1 Tax=Streblomastix strix TaxID=222440 RepID=A0A5J4USV2_9EUKA|nr:MAG: hypothetical protein EZS28_030974 [Streblomastix strix]